MTHGEWIISIVTFAYALVSFFTLLAVRKQARTAEATVETMKDSAQRQLRAYVLPINAQTISRGGLPWISVEIRNSGATPAYNYKGFLAKDISERGQQRTDVTLPPGVETSQAIIPPNGTLELGGPMNDLAPQQAIEIAAGTQAIYVYGSITYMDAFGNPRSTKFRFECTGELLALGRFAACVRGNEAD